MTFVGSLHNPKIMLGMISAGSTALIEEVGFAADSLVEGDGFEPSIPRLW
jgi:hypothetical protein